MIVKQTSDIKEELFKKIADLPEDQVQEVFDFVAFLVSKQPKIEDTILNVAGCLSGGPLSAKEIEEELYGKEMT